MDHIYGRNFQHILQWCCQNGGPVLGDALGVRHCISTCFTTSSWVSSFVWISQHKPMQSPSWKMHACPSCTTQGRWSVCVREFWILGHPAVSSSREDKDPRERWVLSHFVILRLGLGCFFFGTKIWTEWSALIGEIKMRSLETQVTHFLSQNFLCSDSVVTPHGVRPPAWKGRNGFRYIWSLDARSIDLRLAKNCVAGAFPFCN